MNNSKNSLVLSIGEKMIGDGQPTFIIAEIGSNHNQDYDLACRTIDAAAVAGVDAVKFQTFRAKDHYSINAPGFSYLSNQNTYELIKSLELNRSWQEGLMRHAEQAGLIFLSSPCDSDAIFDLFKLNMSAFKVASFDLTDDQLIYEMAATGKPLIMSTGMATWMDIQFALNAASKANNDQIILLQCTSLYPAAPNLTNLNAMSSMRHAFGTLVGYSDHTIGDHISLAAVARGACVIEKHFTLNRSLPGPDHGFAIEPVELAEMVKKIKDIEAAFGDGFKNGPRNEEYEMAEKGRRSLHARIFISAGQTITEDMLVSKRPGLGLPPFLKENLIGRIASRDIAADEWITWDMF